MQVLPCVPLGWGQGVCVHILANCFQRPGAPLGSPVESEHPFPPSFLAKQVPHAWLGSVETTPLTLAGSSGSIRVRQGQ